MPNDIAKLKRIMRQANYLTNQSPANGNKAYAMRAAWEIEKIREYLRTGLVSFSYAKVNGDARTALGTTNPLLIPTAAVPKSPDIDIPRERLGLITYYDLYVNGWRSFYFYSLDQIDHVWTFNYDVFLEQKSLEKRPIVTVNCEYCGKTLPKSEAKFCEDGGFYACPDCADKNLVTCERCGMLIDRDSAYQGFDGYLCECCHDDLFG